MFEKRRQTVTPNSRLIEILSVETEQIIESFDIEDKDQLRSNNATSINNFHYFSNPSIQINNNKKYEQKFQTKAYLLYLKLNVLHVINW